MKKNKYSELIIILMLLTLLSSCLLTKTPNYLSAINALPSDVSNYADFIIDDCELPDGSIVKVYVYNNVEDGISLQNIQSRKYDPEFETRSKERIKQIQEDRYSSKDLIDFWKWKPTGPLSPYMKADRNIYQKYGKKKYLEMIKGLSIISYYNLEDLGMLAKYMTNNSIAQACFEDNRGVFFFTICPVKNLTQIQKNTEVQREHKGQFGYEIVYIPKSEYTEKKIPKLQPTKTSTVNPNSIPDTDYSLLPNVPNNNSKYYYDEIFAYQLQWLAVQVACKGTYDMAYTGDFSSSNPEDYYKTSYIKKYLAENDGKASKGTLLFEGICFDYADFAYQELQKNFSNYSNIVNYYMVGTFDDYDDIIVYRLAKDNEKSNFVINRTPVIIYNHQHILSHGNATHHAWFWVQTIDGTVYWIDPTWTDNNGYPVYGIVRGGKEIQLEPDPKLCIK